MPDIVLRAVPDDPADDGRELARAFIPGDSVEDVLALVNRAIEYGHEMSYVEAEGEPCEVCGAWPIQGITFHFFHPKTT